MYTITLNIGLNNNPLKKHEIADFLESELNIQSISYRIDEGQYNLSPEPTMIVRARTGHSQDVLIRAIQKLCVETTQECIPFQTKELSDLIYDPNFTGKRYEFNEQYFLSL